MNNYKRLYNCWKDPRVFFLSRSSFLLVEDPRKWNNYHRNWMNKGFMCLCYTLDLIQTKGIATLSLCHSAWQYLSISSLSTVRHTVGTHRCWFPLINRWIRGAQHIIHLRIFSTLKAWTLWFVLITEILSSINPATSNKSPQITVPPGLKVQLYEPNVGTNVTIKHWLHVTPRKTNVLHLAAVFIYLMIVHSQL